MKRFVKQIGSRKEGNFYINTTTWDGERRVLVITPQNPTPKQVKETKDFLLNELDDHDVFQKYMKLINR